MRMTQSPNKKLLNSLKTLYRHFPEKWVSEFSHILESSDTLKDPLSFYTKAFALISCLPSIFPDLNQYPDIVKEFQKLSLEYAEKVSFYLQSNPTETSFILKKEFDELQTVLEKLNQLREEYSYRSDVSKRK